MGRRKTGGRRRGTPNRLSGELAEQLSQYGLDVPQEIVKTLPKLKAESRAKVLLELMSFLYPKRKAVEFVPEDRTSKCIKIEFVEPPVRSPTVCS